ncbi:MAG: hypothetical protein C3F07_15365 [Anaerolineales bacterium]|nr:CPBP family intramembrane metalloprotease [Anaerolineae bacterium]PWB70997.1 MAG: hypothetical protein C3F07_15365 [Anaerolineales bacterium]
MNLEFQNSVAPPESPDYSVPWKPIDNWIGVVLLVLLDVALLFYSALAGGTQLAQSAGLILVQLAYLLPLVLIFAYRRVNPKSLGLGGFDWGTLALGIGLLFVSYILILIHNSLLLLLGVEVQGEKILTIFESLESPVWFMIVGVILAPIVEELFFRGFLFQGFRQRHGWVKGMLISAAIFAVGHLDPASLIPTFILGALLAYMYQRSNSVWPGVILHVMVNALGLCAAYIATQYPGTIPL